MYFEVLNRNLHRKKKYSNATNLRPIRLSLLSLKVRGMLRYGWIEDDEICRNTSSEFLYHVPEGCGDPIYILVAIHNVLGPEPFQAA